MIDEEDHNTLISHRISSDEIYRKQEGMNVLFFMNAFVCTDHYFQISDFSLDTIISWRDPELSTEVALSFQEPTGCSYIW